MRLPGGAGPPGRPGTTCSRRGGARNGVGCGGWGFYANVCNEFAGCAALKRWAGEDGPGGRTEEDGAWAHRAGQGGAGRSSITQCHRRCKRAGSRFLSQVAGMCSSGWPGQRAGKCLPACLPTSWHWLPQWHCNSLHALPHKQGNKDVGSDTQHGMNAAFYYSIGGNAYPPGRHDAAQQLVGWAPVFGLQ